MPIIAATLLARRGDFDASRKCVTIPLSENFLDPSLLALAACSVANRGINISRISAEGRSAVVKISIRRVKRNLLTLSGDEALQLLDVPVLTR